MNGYYKGNHYVVVAVGSVVATTVVDAATWNGFGSRFRMFVHNDILDCLFRNDEEIVQMKYSRFKINHLPAAK